MPNLRADTGEAQLPTPPTGAAMAQGDGPPVTLIGAALAPLPAHNPADPPDHPITDALRLLRPRNPARGVQNRRTVGAVSHGGASSACACPAMGQLRSPERSSARPEGRCISARHNRSLLADEIAAARGLPRGAVPYPGPAFGGVHARALVLLEAPGPATDIGKGSGLLSLENDDPTAARAYRTAGLDVARCVHWNLVPRPTAGYEAPTLVGPHPSNRGMNVAPG